MYSLKTLTSKNSVTVFNLLTKVMLYAYTHAYGNSY